eukprot:TRINITY_DN14_c0_g2_i1.p2 TRINITY_DN14_c0_g2~~TRINITY_DN14_c0_g2_i1.p2  ORF type:complete len:165 (+),score=96.28 TRINITY_DN14_c0_g2_i1:48-497(+)
MMKAVFVALFLFAAVVLANEIEATGPVVEDGVLVLTDKNFDENIKAHKHVLVDLYAPWCGHCKRLTPEYAKAAQALEAEGSAVKLAKVDATVETELKTRFQLRGFPTLLFFTNGEYIKYTGPRDAAGIQAWIAKTIAEADAAAPAHQEL